MKRLFVLAVVVTLTLPMGAEARQKPVSPGDFFPQYRFVADLSSGDAAYLGVAEAVRDKGEFQAEDTWGDLLVLELFNRFCFGCQQGAPLVNRAYELVASNPRLSTKVRFLGVGVGNNSRSVEAFREEFDVPFPLVPDPRFNILDALGNPGGTPYTILIRRTAGGMMVVATHFGVLDSGEALVEEIRRILTEDVDALLAQAKPSDVAPWVEKELIPPLSDEQLMDRVQASMERAGYGKVGLYTVTLKDGQKVYVGESKRGKVFSRVISRLPVCDVCHPVHFILTVNDKGQVVDFDAISVTKYWNEPLNDEEINTLRKRLLGLSVFEERAFDPEVDAVSTATMSSSLIFDSLIRSGKIMEALKAEGYL